MNWFGFEYAPFVPDGLDHAPLDSILASLRAAAAPLNTRRPQYDPMA